MLGASIISCSIMLNECVIASMHLKPGSNPGSGSLVSHVPFTYLLPLFLQIKFPLLTFNLLDSVHRVCVCFSVCTQFTSKLRYFRLMMRKALSPGAPPKTAMGGAYSLQRSPSHTSYQCSHVTETPPPPPPHQKSPPILFLHPPLHILCSIYYTPSLPNTPPCIFTIMPLSQTISISSQWSGHLSL